MKQFWAEHGSIHPSMALQPLPGLVLPHNTPPFNPICSFTPPSSYPQQLSSISLNHIRPSSSWSSHWSHSMEIYDSNKLWNGYYFAWEPNCLLSDYMSEAIHTALAHIFTIYILPSACLSTCFSTETNIWTWFRLPPLCRWDRRSSGILRSV